LELDDLSFLYGRVANIYMESNEFKQAEKWYKKSLDIAIEKKDTIDMARANWSIYNLNIRQHNNGLAKQAIYKAYDLIAGTKERSVDKCNILQLLALYFYENYNYKLACDLYHQALLEMSSLGISIEDYDYLNYAEYYTHCYGKLSDYLLEHLIDISTRGDTTYSAQRAAAEVGAYYGLFTDDYEKALHYYFKAYHIAKNLNDSRSQFTYLSEIGVIYFIQKDYDNALKYML
jgi:tetratricopeptide (TPR) repeat protein